MTEVAVVANNLTHSDIFPEWKPELHEWLDGNNRRRIKVHTMIPLLQEFCEVLLDELTERAEPLFDNPNSMCLCYQVVAFNICEMTVIALDRLVVARGSTANLKYIISRLWAALFAADIACGLCTDRESWQPPRRTVAILTKIGAILR